MIASAPLRIAPWRQRRWAVGLFLIGLAPIIAAPFLGFHDWAAFWSAGNVVGTGDLVNAARLIAWQQEHGLGLGVFAYLPATAFLLWPLAQIPLALSFWIWALAMMACAVMSGRIAARVFGLSTRMAVGSALAWAPVTGAVVIGQNTPLALLLAMVALEGLAGGRPRRAGLGAGLLLYKPTLGLPIVGLLVLRKGWQAVAIVSAMAVGWYVTGIVASGGNVGWPGAWLETVLDYAGPDAALNADKALSLPGLLVRLPIPGVIAVAAGAAIVLAAIPRLVRAPMAEAAAGACLVGVAASPHAWGYDAVLLLPVIWWALAGGIAEPWRTRLIVAAYVLAPFWLISRQTQVSTLAVVVLVAAAVWVLGLWRAPDAPVPSDAARVA